MDEASIKAIEQSVGLVQADLKALLKSHPKFAMDHPEIYHMFGMEKEAKKAYEQYRKLEAKAGDAASKLDPMLKDLVSALVNQGCPKPQAEEAARVAKEGNSSGTFNELFREALKLVGS